MRQGATRGTITFGRSVGPSQARFHQLAGRRSGASLLSAFRCVSTSATLPGGRNRNHLSSLQSFSTSSQYRCFSTTCPSLQSGSSEQKHAPVDDIMAQLSNGLKEGKGAEYFIPVLTTYVANDTEEAFSRAVLQWKPSTTVAEEQPVSGVELLARVQSKFASSVEVLEMTSRSLANIAMLSAESFSSTSASASDSDVSAAADVVAKTGALERTVEQLAAKVQAEDSGTSGTVCTSLALARISTLIANVAMLSVEGAGRLRGLESELELIFSSLVSRLYAAAEGNGSNSSADSNSDVERYLRTLTLDNLLCALVRMLSMSLTTDSAKAQFYFQCVSYGLIVSVCRCLAAIGAHVEEDNIEVHHKCWEALRIISSHKPNVVLVCQAFSEYKISWKQVIGRAEKTIFNFSEAALIPGGAAPPLHLRLSFETAVMAVFASVGATGAEEAREVSAEDTPKATIQNEVGDAVAQVRATLASGNTAKFIIHRVVSFSRLLPTPSTPGAHWPWSEVESSRWTILNHQFTVLTNLVCEGDAEAYNSGALAVIGSFMERLLENSAAAGSDSAAAPPAGVEELYWRLGMYLWNVMNDQNAAPALKELRFEELLSKLYRQAPASYKELSERLFKKYQALIGNPEYLK
jgi:hypothetical protein